MKILVIIDRAEPEIFEGVLLAETDTHYYVQHGVNPEIGEWFAKQSSRVHCKII